MQQFTLTPANRKAPAYVRLQESIIDLIEANEAKGGDLLPSEHTLAKRYNVSVGTVKKAFSNLVNAGYCYRVQGKGTFVMRSHLKKENVKYYSLTNSFLVGQTPLEVMPLSLESSTAPKQGQNVFKPDEECWRVSRLFQTGGQPVIYTHSYLLKSICPDLPKLTEHDIASTALYRLIEDRFFVHTVHSEEAVQAVLADKTVAPFLQLEPGAPVLFIRMIAHTTNMLPFEYRESWVRTTHYGLSRIHTF